jgi:hypothetical protein
LADAVDWLSGVTRGEAFELAVHGESPGVELHPALTNTGWEAIERSDWRPTHTPTQQIVDATMARADEALGGIDPAHRAAEMRAARGDRDVGRGAIVGVGVERVVVLAHVGGRLAGLADSGTPMSSQKCGGCLKIGPIAKPSAGSVKEAAAIAPAVWAVPVMKRRRVTVSPSKAPGIIRSAVYFDL